MKRLTVILPGLLGAALLGALVSLASVREAKALRPLTVSLEGVADGPHASRMAMFRVENPNAEPIVFRIFGPQIRNADGSWPNLAHGFGQVRRLLPLSGLQVGVPASVGPEDWRIQVVYEPRRTLWQRGRQWMQLFQSLLGFPEFIHPPAEVATLPPIMVEVAGEK